MLKLTPEDKEFVKLSEEGVRPSAAFREAYPEHHAVKLYYATESGTPDRQKASEILKDAAKNKLAAKYIKHALMTYSDKMEEFSKLSLDSAIDLVQNARSEKVRADLAIEGMRHKVGTPTQKIAIQDKKVVHITFGEPPKDESEIIEGEIVSSEQHDLSETDDTSDTDKDAVSQPSSPSPSVSSDDF